MSESCPDPERFERILNGEDADPREREQWERHLEGCESCRELLALEGDLRQVFSAVPAPELSEGFTGQLEARLTRQRQDRRGSHLKRRVLQGYWVGALAATAVILQRLGGVAHLLEGLDDGFLLAGVLALGAATLAAKGLRLDVPGLIWRAVLAPRF